MAEKGFGVKEVNLIGASGTPTITSPNNLNLKIKIEKIKEKLKNGQPTIPSILSDEIESNIFLKAKDVESFSKLRDLKDSF